METPEVSVIIPTYNRADFVTDAIESVLAQTRTDFEVVVIDDGSTDDTREVLAPYTNRIRYIPQENRGLTVCVVTGGSIDTDSLLGILGDPAILL